VANKEVTNILLVEGNSDIKFFEALINYTNIGVDDFEISKFVQFDSIGGSDFDITEKAIQSLITDLRKNPIRNFGIIMDLDEYNTEDRFKQIKDILINIFGEEAIKQKSESELFLRINDKKTILVNCYFIEDKIVTNLELLLKRIATVEPIAANCLSNWYDCVKASERNIRRSDYLKFWREVYIRYDYCSDKKLLKHAADNCTVDKSYSNLLIRDKKKAWDFDHEILNNLKDFLKKFTN
jgi:hypothetical protein